MMSVYRLGTLGTDGKDADAASHYYSERGADYYVKGQPNDEQEGQWVGQGIGRLGITEGPDRRQLQLALAGYIAGRKVQNAGHPKRRMGWDLTVSAPKSVSLAWAFADPVHQQEIRKAHVAAAKVAYRYLESQVTTRRGKGGARSEPAYLASSLFTHHSSREGDPQLHSHIVVPNICVRSDGTVGTLESQTFFDLKMAAGALYQAELANRMKNLGYGITAGEKGSLRLAASSLALEMLFSKRKKDIDRIAKEQGIQTYKGTRDIVRTTRKVKKHTTLAEREAHWRQEAKEANLSTTIERKDKALDQDAREAWAKENLGRAGEKLTEQNSVFFEGDHIREIAMSAYGVLNAGQVQVMAEMERSHGHVVKLGKDKKGRQAYTTPEMEGVERGMISLVREMAAKKDFGVDPSKSIQETGFLSDEQKASVLSATAENGISIIQGRAGAGKTTTLVAVRRAYEQAGWKVQGLAISGLAAHNMQKESGIESRTIASWKQGPIPESKTVLIVDEAGMVGSKSMREILHRAYRAEAKVILVGDEKQLQPIEAGGALHEVDKELTKIAPRASSQIQTIRRQKDEWMRKVVHNAAQGKTAEALQALDERGKIHVYASAKGAKAALVKEYLDSDDGFEHSLILTIRKGDAYQINDMVREELHKRGVVGEDRVKVFNTQRQIDIAIGDRLMFLRNNRNMKVRNGQRGTVKGIDVVGNWLFIRTDEEEDKKISLDKYKFLEYGWASTTHKAQGATVDRAYVYGHTKESAAHRQATYVQISRAKEETKIYAVAGERAIEREIPDASKSVPMEKTEERAKALEQMAKSWSRDGSKGTSLEFLREQKLQQKLIQQKERQGMER